MSAIFSDQNKYTTWHKLWLALAKAEKAVGLPITLKQIKAMEKQVGKIDFAKAAKYEKSFKHDVMAHLHAFADQCPDAKGIIHLGATSAFVTDNTDLIQIRSALELLKSKLISLLKIMGQMAGDYSDYPTLGYTHLQPAQPTSLGKRICLWMQDLLSDTHDLITREKELRFLGLKGAIGTQASFMTLLNNDSRKVEKLETLVAKEMGFTKSFIISAQTYTRKQDMRILSVLEGLAASSHKCATDLRLLAHLGEMAEGHGKTQIGSSAMPHKRNPIRAERTCALARYLISLCQNPAYTLATQWLERSLDDSANRRLVIPESFLCADALLNLLLSLFVDMEIFPEVIEENLSHELSQIALENILMHAVKKGRDRQETHELLRKAPHKGRERAKEFGLSKKEIDECFEPQIGRAQEQVTRFLREEVAPLLSQYKNHPISIQKLDV